MAQIQDAASATHNTRRAPIAHSEAVQEAKRLEKMQTHSSSHRASGTGHKTAAAVKDATS